MSSIFCYLGKEVRPEERELLMLCDVVNPGDGYSRLVN